eukprot:Opistho-1_new@108863
MEVKAEVELVVELLRLCGNGRERALLHKGRPVLDVLQEEPAHHAAQTGQRLRRQRDVRKVLQALRGPVVDNGRWGDLGGWHNLRSGRQVDGRAAVVLPGARPLAPLRGRPLVLRLLQLRLRLLLRNLRCRRRRVFHRRGSRHHWHLLEGRRRRRRRCLRRVLRNRERSALQASIFPFGGRGQRRRRRGRRRIRSRGSARVDLALFLLLGTLAGRRRLNRRLLRNGCRCGRGGGRDLRRPFCRWRRRRHNGGRRGRRRRGRRHACRLHNGKRLHARSPGAGSERHSARRWGLAHGGAGARIGLRVHGKAEELRGRADFRVTREEQKVAHDIVHRPARCRNLREVLDLVRFRRWYADAGRAHALAPRGRADRLLLARDLLLLRRKQVVRAPRAAALRRPPLEHRARVLRVDRQLLLFG